MPRAIRTQIEADNTRGPLTIDADEPIDLYDREATIKGGKVYLHGDCTAEARGAAVVVAHDHSRVRVGMRAAGVVVTANDFAEVDAGSGYIYAGDHARLFLTGTVSAEVTDRVLALAEGRATIYLEGGAPTVRSVSHSVRIVNSGKIGVGVRVGRTANGRH